MNYSQEINRLNQKYGKNPATQKCLEECLTAWHSFARSTVETIERSKEKRSK